MKITAAFVSFILSVLSGAGVGSGGLFTLFLTSFMNHPQKEAQGINLMIFASALLPAVIIYAKKKKADLGLASFFALCGMSGCVTGAFAASHAPAGTLRTVFGLFLIFAGVVSFYKTVNIKKLHP